MIEPNHWPIITVSWYIFAFITSYTIGVNNGHVYYFFPYISDSGAIPPESCYFGQMMNVGAVFMLITMYFKYKQVELTAEALQLDLSPKWNIAAKWFGFGACIGLDVVANFQEIAQTIVHIIGALMAFTCGVLYFITQTRISYSLRKAMKGSPFRIHKVTFYLRLITCLLMIPISLVVLFATAISLLQFDGEDIYYWTPKHKGYFVHLFATFSEWMVALLFLTYIASLSNELKSVKFYKIEVVANVV